MRRQAGSSSSRLHVFRASAGCAAALATLKVYKDEGLFERAAELAPYWEDAGASPRACLTS